MNKIRISLLACVSVAPVLVAGCALYGHPSACERQMRSALAAKSPADVLSISHVGVGIGGSRVVVEGQIESPASAPAAASAASAVSSAKPQKATKVTKPAAVECTFNGDALASLRWLAPPEMAEPSASSGSGDN